MVTFNTTLISGGGNTTGIEIPEDVVLGLGRGKRVPVVVTVNGDTFRNTTAFMGGQYLVGVSAAHRAASGLKGGDAIEVTLEVDDAPRVVEGPRSSPRRSRPIRMPRRRGRSSGTVTSGSTRSRSSTRSRAETKARRVAKTLEILKG